MTPKDARYALADAMAAALPDGWSVYATPPEGITAPAVTIAPRQPYLTQNTYCQLECRLAIVVAIQRNASTVGLDQMDDIIGTLRAAMPPGFVVDDVTDLGPVQEAGGVDYLTSTINVTAQAE